MRTAAEAIAHRDLQVRADLVAGIYRHIPRSSVGVVAGAGTVVWGMWGQVFHAFLAAWLFSVCAIVVWRLTLTQKYDACTDKTGTVGYWEHRWTLSTGLHGVLWGSSAIFMFVPGSPEYQALVLIALFAICTAAVPLIARHRASLYAFVLPTLIPITIRLAFAGSAAQILLAIFSALVMYGIFLFGHELNRTIIESVQRRYENLDLIEQLRHQTAVAEAARNEADRANQMKSRFLAAASHDLRQPLHALGLFSASLRRRVKDAEVTDIVDHVYQSVETLEQMFDALLDISRLETGGTKAQSQPFALQPLFDRLMRDCRPDAEAKGLALSFVGTRGWVQSDPMLVERILRNLVVNAIRHTPSGGVLVGCRRRASALSIEVWDTGPGIAREHQDRVFEEFYQVAENGAKTRQGLGLGLATVQRLSSILGVPLSLRSIPGRGSAFSFELPRTHARIAATPQVESTAADYGLLADAIIVVIDDDPGALAAMREALGSWHAHTVAAASPDAALEGLADFERYPDAVVSDLRLGAAGDGLQAIARIRNELGFAIPALVVTGDTAPASVREIEATGLEWLAKPVTADRLYGVLVDLLGRNDGSTGKARRPPDPSPQPAA